jgi:hypothetical protein
VGSSSGTIFVPGKRFGPVPGATDEVVLIVARPGGDGGTRRPELPAAQFTQAVCGNTIAIL